MEMNEKSLGQKLAVAALISVGVVGLTALAGTSALATPTYYVGYDTTAATFTALTTNPGPPTVPGTLTAQNALVAAEGAQNLGTAQTYDYGNLTGSTSTTGGNVSGGITSSNGEVSIGFTNEAFVNVYSTSIETLSNQGANNVPNGGTSETLGFSTVSSTGNYVLIQGGTGLNTVVFTFAQPVTSFGLFITGLGNSGGSPVTASFNDGSAETFLLNGSSATSGALGSTTSNYTQTPTKTGGAEYFGFTDTSGVSSLTFSQTNGGSDRYSIDNYTYTTVIPEPSTVTLLSIGAAAVAGMLLRKRRQGLIA